MTATSTTQLRADAATCGLPPDQVHAWLAQVQDDLRRVPVASRVSARGGTAARSPAALAGRAAGLQQQPRLIGRGVAPPGRSAWLTRASGERLASPRCGSTSRRPISRRSRSGTVAVKAGFSFVTATPATKITSTRARSARSAGATTWSGSRHRDARRCTPTRSCTRTISRRSTNGCRYVAAVVELEEGPAS